MVRLHRASTRFKRSGLLWLGLASLSSACGVGDEVSLGRYTEHKPDADTPDTGQDASALLDAGDGSTPEAGEPDPDAGPAPHCVVPLDRNPVLCAAVPPEVAYSPRVKWRFPPASLQLPQTSAPGTPLVANLTDDNGDGRVDLCDMPDVVVAAGSSMRGTALWVLNGDSGRVEYLIDRPLLPGVAPAIADLNRDGFPEIIAIDGAGHLIALKPDGELIWEGAVVERTPRVLPACYAISVYDLEGDGNPEILAGFEVFDSQGKRRMGATMDAIGAVLPAIFDSCIAPIAADLDADGQLEVLFGHEILRTDGTQYWLHEIGQIASIPVVANLDADPQLELVLSSPGAVYIVEPSAELSMVRASILRDCGGDPPSVHDFNGDGVDELAFPNCKGEKRVSLYKLGETTLDPLWSVTDRFMFKGYSSLAGFDFFGRKQANLVYADEQSSAVYAGIDDRLIFEGIRPGTRMVGSPVIADIDNDDSADILLPAYESGEPALLTVLEQEGTPWMNARRIWNQHAYHVNNVHEDGTIPRGPADAPQVATRMRSNAHRQGNQLCVPP